MSSWVRGAAESGFGPSHLPYGVVTTPGGHPELAVRIGDHAMSLARLHHRKDITSRLLTDGPVSPVALAWPEGETPPLVEAFIGIVRGRTANSSR